MTLIAQNTVVAKTRKLTASWSFEDPHKPRHWLWQWIQEIIFRMRYLVTGQWPLSWTEDRMFKAMADEIRREVDNEILEALRAQQDEMGM